MAGYVTPLAVENDVISIYTCLYCVFTWRKDLSAAQLTQLAVEHAQRIG